MLKVTRSLAAISISVLALAVGAARAAEPPAPSSATATSSEIQRAREFVVMGYQGIVFDLDSGDGPYLRTLLDLLKSDPGDRSATVGRIRTLAKTYPNIMDFADATLKLREERAAAEVALSSAPVPSGPTVYSGDRLEGAVSHLTRGMKVTVITRGGARYAGKFDEYTSRRLWITGAARRSFLLDEIAAIDAPQL